MSQLPVPASADGAFKAWALGRATARKGGLSPRSPDVRAYLEALNPRAQVRGLLHVSTVTQRRYYRVLKKIYDFAVAEQWLESNPVDAGASVSPTEQMDSLVFHAIDWDSLLRAIAPPVLPSHLPPPPCSGRAIRIRCWRTPGR